MESGAWLFRVGRPGNERRVREAGEAAARAARFRCGGPENKAGHSPPRAQARFGFLLPSKSYNRIVVKTERDALSLAPLAALGRTSQVAGRRSQAQQAGCRFLFSCLLSPLSLLSLSSLSLNACISSSPVVTVVGAGGGGGGNGWAGGSRARGFQPSSRPIPILGLALGSLRRLATETDCGDTLPRVGALTLAAAAAFCSPSWSGSGSGSSLGQCRTRSRPTHGTCFVVFCSWLLLLRLVLCLFFSVFRFPFSVLLVRLASSSSLSLSLSPLLSPLRPPPCPAGIRRFIWVDCARSR